MSGATAPAPVLVDANVLIDIATSDPVWAAWSEKALASVGAQLVINPLIYAEVSVAYARSAEVDRLLPGDVFRREALPWEAAFLAGKAFRAYRQRGGSRTGVLPDFYIGAHAVIAGYRLLSRDRGRYATYFPEVVLIAP